MQLLLTCKVHNPYRCALVLDVVGDDDLWANGLNNTDPLRELGGGKREFLRDYANLYVNFFRAVSQWSALSSASSDGPFQRDLEHEQRELNMCRDRMLGLFSEILGKVDFGLGLTEKSAHNRRPVEKKLFSSAAEKREGGELLLGESTTSTEEGGHGGGERNDDEFGTRGDGVPSLERIRNFCGLKVLSTLLYVWGQNYVGQRGGSLGKEQLAQAFSASPWLASRVSRFHAKQFQLRYDLLG
jgi:hypothetical protein